MADNNFAVQFTIAAGLAAGFTSAFSKARSAFTGLDKDTRALYNAQKELDSQIKSTQNAIANYSMPIAKAREQLRGLRKDLLNNQKAQLSQSWQGMQGGVMQVMKGIGVGAVFSQPVRDAMQFESAMADVRKVVDGLDNETAFKGMSDDILKLSTELPMTAEGIAKIVAAGGQSGIARSELMGFATDAAKMGIAFDITADQAGDMMAKWRTAFKMGQTDVVGLADKINYLGNTTAASAPLIADVVTRIGPLGAVGGVASGEIAALGASMVGTGVQSEVAATGIKNLILGMTAGAGATKTQAQAFASLGFDAVEMSKRMQTDAKGAILDVMKAIQSLNPDEQATVLKDLFGKESIGAIAPLLSNLDALQDNFNKVGDKAQYAGSMEQEYISRCNTAENATQLFKNAVEAISISLGQALLPHLKTVAVGLAGMAKGFATFIQEHPMVGSALTVLTAGVIGLYIAMGVGSVVGNAFRAVLAIGKIGMLGFQLMTSSATAALVAQKIVMVATRIAHVAFVVVLMALRGAMAVATAAQWAFNAALSANPIGLVIIAIIAVVAALVYCYTHFEGFRNVVNSVIFGIANNLLWLWNSLVAGCSSAMSWVSSMWQAFVGWVSSAIDTASSIIASIWDTITSTFDSIYQWLSDKWESIKSIFSSPIEAIVNVTQTGNAGPTADMAMAGAIPGFAVGGHVTSPTLAMVGEGGDEEYIVPINNSERSRQLWQEAGAKLGMYGQSKNTNSFASRANSLLASGTSTKNSVAGKSGAQYTYAPNITISGTADKNTIGQALRTGFTGFKDMIDKLEHENRRVAFD